FFQAEDGIRDFHVTGVQTCALPIFKNTLQEYFDEVHYAQRVDDADWAYELSFERETQVATPDAGDTTIKPYAVALFSEDPDLDEIGRASCRERVEIVERGESIEEEC